jgi:chemotaxis protein MotB
MILRTRSNRVYPSRERWLVSYADFITLLFALFVVLFAASNADKEKMRRFAQAVESAIAHSGVRKTAGAPQTPPPPREPVLNAAYATLTRSLQPEMQNNQVSLALHARGLVITLNQTAFFVSGSAELVPSMYPTLGKIAGAIARIGNPIRLEGHTDSRPIHNGRFESNWALSSARSIAVLELLAHRFDIAPERMAVAGYADTAPVSPNDTEEGRARNRRVDIVVLSQDVLEREPGGNH